MHKTHIFEQKNNQQKKNLTYLPYFFRVITGNKQKEILGLILDSRASGHHFDTHPSKITLQDTQNFF